MQVKTQKQVMALQNKAQKVADKLNEEVIFITKGVQHIQVQAGTAYQLNTKDFNAKKSSLIAKKVGDDLEVALEEGVIIFDNYFAVCATDLSCLVSLPTEDGGLYHIVTDVSFTLENGTQIVYFYGEQSIVSTESSAVSTNNNQSFSDIIASNVGIVAAVVVTAVVVASSGSSDNDDNDNDDDKLSFTFNDIGLLNNDRITNDNTIAIDGLKEGETWQYSTDGGATFASSTGKSFTLDDGTYVADTIQIKKFDVAGNLLDIAKINETSDIIIDTEKSVFTSSTTVNVEKDTAASEIIYTAETDDNTVVYTLKDGNQKGKFTIDNATGKLKYKDKQTQVGQHKVTIIATDIAGNETEQLITVSVEESSLSTSVVWNSIGDDKKINANEMATATLSGTVVIIGTVTSIRISSIVFKKDNTVAHTISNNLPKINSDNTWSLDNDDTWTSKLTQSDYTVTVYLSGDGGNGGNVRDSNFITTAIDTVKPDQPTFTLEDTGLLDNDGITNNSVITVSGLEVGATWQYSISGDNGFTNGTGSSFTLTDNTTYEANTIQIRQTDIAGNISDISKNTSRIVVNTIGPIFEQQPTEINANIHTSITTTVYDAQATNLNGNADEGITYSIKGVNADKFSITANTGILTYKTIQTLAHNDAVIIVATDIVGNETEQLIIVSVKEIGLSTSIVWSGIGNDNKINANEIAATTLSGTVAIIGAVTSINISSIVFKQDDTIAHTISANLPSVNTSDNTWTLDNNDTWTSKLTQGDYTITINLSGNNGSVTDSSSITTAVDIAKPAQPVFSFVDTGLLNNDGITNNGVITVNNLEVGATWQYSISSDGFVNGTGSSFTLANNTTYEANAIQVRQTDVAGNVSDIGKNTLRIVVDNTGPIFDSQPTTVNVNANAPITTTVYDAQVTNLNGGIVDEGITYRIKGTDADKFSITTDTGILTYTEKQTSVHNDTVTIVATDVAGNKVEQLITVSVKGKLVRGFAINGEDAGDHNGVSASTAGDVNGDGLDDLIVGAHRANLSGKPDAGKSYVVFGKIDSTAINLSAIASGTGGFVINGENENDLSGRSVSSAGDVNGDGLDDLIVGVDQAYVNGKQRVGKSYVIFGKIDSTAINQSAIVNGTGGFVINGESAFNQSGHSVSTAGDVNGDGLDDLIVGAHGVDLSGKSNAGKSYVIFGKKDSTAINLSVISNGTGGFVIIGENEGDNSGYSVSSAGDVNGDGLDDLIIGADKADLGNKFDTGKSYVIFGKTDSTAIYLSTIASGTGGFVINGENVDDISGNSVSTAGDVNGDGLDDLIVGSKYADLSNKTNAGKSYVIFGKTDNTAVNLSAIVSGTGGFVINGENASNYSGYTVSTAGDVNGDGLDDLIIGATEADSNGKLDTGKSYVIFGKTDTDAIDLTKLSGNLKYTIDYLGDENNNTLTGASDDEIFVAGMGDDILIGNGGMDVFNAGAGNDTITINASNITALAQTNVGNRARVDGGGNIDTLTLDGSGLTLDLTNISNARIQDIEKIDITGSGNNTLILNLNDVFDASTSTNILKVLGNSGDSVNALGFAKISNTETEGSITYDVYTHSSANTDANAALWIQQDIDLVVV
ncbi:hypothetical protein [uncultured Gammaproteobacteria bacterium]|nr:hypothetical protein [uncultured Gammaproteobacteria bacterium]CAC9624720.1 hypothetical protein [uncultured Gammaproteobacteria bacterium]